MKLDDAAVASLKLDGGRTDAIFFDDDLSGFGLRLRLSGKRIRRSWIVQYRARGRTRRMLIGPVAKITAKQARKAAHEQLAKVVLGGDPQAEKEAARADAAHTLRSVVRRYLEAKEASLRPASFRVTKLYLTGSAYFGPLHSAPVAEITLADVAARLNTITHRNGSVTAGRARSALSGLFRWAMGEGLLGPRPINPVIGTNVPADAVKRDRVLSDVELLAIWRACGDDDEGRIVRLLILTGARRQEVGGMRWGEIDMKAGLWSLPRHRAKNNHSLELPLPTLALSIIASVPRRVDRDCLFGERSAVGFTRWGECKAALDERLAGQVEPWRFHDLRRTCATRLGDLGVQPHVIEAVLNHYGGHRRGVAGIYNRSPYEREVRSALALWADHIEALVEGGERKVIPLQRPAATAT